MAFMPPSHYHIINQGGVYDVFFEHITNSDEFRILNLSVVG
jgi:hypothetical protein